MRKLGARNLVELLKLAAAMGLVALPRKREPVERTLQMNEHPTGVLRARDHDFGALSVCEVETSKVR
jgi:hypothetical protein